MLVNFLAQYYTLKGIGTTLKAVTLGFSTVNSTNVQILPNSMYYL